MKVLMFGWEFPPHISGGLGTACYGLTKGLKSVGEVEVVFVVPKAFGDEEQKAVKIISASSVAIKSKQSVEKISKEEEKNNYSELKQYSQNYQNITVKELFKNFTYVEVVSLLLPYLSPVELEKIISDIKYEHEKVFINKEGKLVYVENSIEKEITINKSELFSFDKEEKFEFSGKYGPNLITEVLKYAEIAGNLAQRIDFDVIHAHDWLTYLAGIAAKKVTGKPLIIHVHATEFDRSGENINQFVYDIEKYGMLMADKIITVSNLTKQIVIDRYGIDSDKVTTIYNAVEPQKAEKYNFQSTVKEKIVTFLGRVTFQKGPEYFVEAAYKVLQKCDNVRFVMAGSGDMLNRMIERASRLRICDKFHFTDFLKGKDVTHLLSISDVYVMPSVSEPFGISPLEAMRSNVPVVISKQSGVSEILNHAIKVDFWDIDAIADSIYGLLHYDALSQMFIQLGKQEVDSLKWENAARNVKEVYHSVIFNN